MLYTLQLVVFTAIAMTPLALALGIAATGTPPVELVLSVGALLLPLIGLGSSEVMGSIARTPYFAY